jgi:cell division protein FtsA
LFVDVGGGTTDVALVRQGGIEGTRMFALGGRAFTKSIADRLELPFPRAEALKVDYARGIAGDRTDAVREIVDDDVAVWAAGVELVMDELAAGDLLPGRIYLCGGGSRLPEIREALAADAFVRHLPFARPPEVTILAPDQIETIRDETQLLEDQQDVTPMGLAYQAIELGSSTNPIDASLRRVVRAMKI